MANITEEKWIEMLEKKSDGSYTIKYPKVKSKSGITFDEHLAENVTTHNVSRGVSNFAGNGQEVTIPHGLPVTPTAAYAFSTVNPEGYLGEVWIRMDETNLYIGNSGSFNGEMCWVAIA